MMQSPARLKVLPHARFGDDPRPPIILIHGFAGGRGSWQLIDKPLGRSRHVIAFDLPGHGFALNWPGPVHPGVAVKEVDASIAAMGLERCHLVGHSMGGAVAALVALRKPDMVASLTLIAAGGLGPEINHDLLTRYANARHERQLTKVHAEFFGPGHPVPRRFMRDSILDRNRPNALPSYKRILPTLFRDGRQGTLDKAAIAGLPCPVKVIWGTADLVLPVTQTDDLPGTIARHVFDGVGHMPPLEVPEEVTRLVLENAAAE